MALESRLSRLALAALLCLGALGIAEASKTGRYDTLPEVAQVWVGVSLDGRSVYRLDLKSDGTGEGGEAFIHENENVFFTIDRWEYAEGRISIQAHAIPPTIFEVGDLAGAVVAGQMHLDMQGKDWKRSIILRREMDLLGPWERLKSAMGEPEEVVPYEEP